MRTVYEPAQQELALPNVLYALSDPIRLEVIRRLACHGECLCGNLDLPIAKSTLSHHLKTLREAGITRTRLEGMHRYISIRSQDLDSRFPGLLQAVLAADAQAQSGATDHPVAG